MLIIPGAAGHAGQASPRGLTITFDLVHLVAGSIWLGGLIGLLVLWFSIARERRVPALTVAVPRFSNVAFASVLALALGGLGEMVVQMPAVNALWEPASASRSWSRSGSSRPCCR